MKTHICVSCRKKFPEDKIEFAPDPYDEDVNGIDKKVWECGPCRYISADDI